MASIFVVTPTYNERNNLEILSKKIFDLKIPELKLIIVDDNSPDGTGKFAEELAKTYPVKVIHREKKMGLGTAYAQAFKELITKEKSDYIIQIDTDLSHDPVIIPQMLLKIRECDLVLGSRYVPGGKIKNWNFFRRMISRWGNIYARFILGLPYKDLTGGFKCFRREVLENINLDSLSSVGYNFQIETTYAAHKKGYKICEIPITFTERQGGASKFNFGIIFESFWKVFLLRFKK
ncbi:MAG: polyprenol monophosphomannose synthase [Patescibacteria group bacterium]